MVSQQSNQGHIPSQDLENSDNESDNVLDSKAFIDNDPLPTFIVPISPSKPVAFCILLRNIAFDAAILSASIEADSRDATLFRSWTQAFSNWREHFVFQGFRWTAYKVSSRRKCIRASAQEPESTSGSQVRTFNAAVDPLKRMAQSTANDARLASLHSIMEASDVGFFEYGPEGTLWRANESWYRLSLHPKGAEADFSFMDLVYPPDESLVLSAWNKLSQGIPVTFEMRWKSANYRKGELGDGIEDAQWVLSACVPIMDEQGKLMSIAGNTIDINAQKRVQAQALQKAQALELARASEQKFKTFALLAPIAIYALDAKGKMTYCNKQFFDLMGQDYVEDYESINWERDIILPEDRDLVSNFWKAILEAKRTSKCHMRLRKTWDLGDGVKRQSWVEAQASPELDGEGNVVSVFGTCSDISRFKWAEALQTERIEEALEAKRKQENFIDMTSHEMRNPLSAVVQCADSTLASLRMISDAVDNIASLDNELRSDLDEELRAAIDSVATIVSCSLHQKRVVDDILTLSKMDSNLLTISPVCAEPAVIVADAVHMFQQEAQKDGIQLLFIEDPSLKALNAQYVQMDPSRSLQILINLITNAMKFTRDSEHRRIEVTLSATEQRPGPLTDGIKFAPIAVNATTFNDNADWGTGGEVYIRIDCSDTGCGLSPAEQGTLFTRFQQATPKTHIRYGGSGLGLWISKRLTELQGGAIGVRSETNVGSTFAFFIKTRRSAPPAITTTSTRQTSPDPIKTQFSSLAKLRSRSEEDTVPVLGANFPESAAAAAAVDASFTTTPAKTSTRIQTPTTPPLSVLIVEDNLVNQKVLSQQLRKAGCTVYVANHGLECLAFLRTTQFWAACCCPPAPSFAPSNSTTSTTDLSGSTTPTTKPIHLDLILMDLEMPIMDGLACTRRIRQLQQRHTHHPLSNSQLYLHPAHSHSDPSSHPDPDTEEGSITAHVPIISVSANARREQVAQARDAGVDASISKPFRIRDLVPLMEGVVSGGGSGGG